MELETKRLLLRPFQENDLEGLYDYAKNPRVGPRAGWKPHENREESRKIMKEIFLNQKTIWAMIRKADGKLMGSIGLIDDPKRQNDTVKMLGYALGEPYWGKGYGTEGARAVVAYGFNDLKLDLISATCYPFNIDSRRVLEKCGMLYEGCLRKGEKRYDGKILDLLSFSLLKEEFPALPEDILSIRSDGK